MSILHHNCNVDIKEQGEKVIKQEGELIDKAANAPNHRIHKRHIFEWQKNLMSFIEINARQRHVIDDQLEIEDEFEDLDDVSKDLDELNLNENRSIPYYESDISSDI